MAEQEVSVLAAALGITCVDPQDDHGSCLASRHIPQAERVLALLRGQGFDVVKQEATPDFHRANSRVPATGSSPKGDVR